MNLTHMLAVAVFAYLAGATTVFLICVGVLVWLGGDDR